MDHEGFHYKINKTRGGKRYYICATPNVYCKGTAIQMENGTIIAKKAHTHEAHGPMFNEQEVIKRFRSTLVERSKTETTPLKVIYDEEIVRNPDAALVYSWPTAESSMRQSRRSVCPAVPSTLRELGEYLDMNTDRYQCNNYNFYQEWIVDNDGKYSVMFACQEIISAVVHQGATELHADATFKVVPSMPHCRQLFMLHLILQNHSVPVCFVLMEVKTEAAYRKVLERFSRKFPEVRPLTIMIDFETALRNVFSDVYPEATVSSCWFHFVQSLQKNIKKMGYSNHVQQHREAKMCLRMCAVLALLPAHQIEQGFQDIKMHAQNNGVLLPRFFTYFTSFWLTRKGPECFSVYNQPRRTNNNVESFHSNLKQTFQVSHPNLWRMLDSEDDTPDDQIPLPAIQNVEAARLDNPVINNGEDSEDEVQDGQINAPPQEVPNVDGNPGLINIDEQNDTSYNEADFFVPEDLALDFWQVNYASDEEDEVPYAPVPQNIEEYLPQGNVEDICVICHESRRTHALIPSGHKVLCVDCVSRLDSDRCPICNTNFNIAIRIWE
ncbi:uncharacterized protein LOC132932730 [Metopolophium dirhodum]|uniref:uncharacterized protein LOC132932730 n=1 Tax=Metopolophium dirhodum TaxID=44670 RepID=UPI00298FC056|nr:uncharacterized protein LOC132932730 [Metopolophium dirhodum]